MIIELIDKIKKKNKVQEEVEIDFKKSFPPLGHPEHHFNKYPNHPWLKTKKEIKKFLKLAKELEYKIHEDLTVSINSISYQLPSKNMTHFPFQIRDVEYLDMDGCNLESAIGSPYLVNSIDLSGNKNLTSFEGITRSIKTVLHLENSGIKGFKNMPVFEKPINIYLDGNKIESWDGFTNCFKVIFWQEEWCERTSYNILMNTPDDIEFISLLFSFRNNNIKIKGSAIDMEWLREEQRKIRKIKQEEKVIEESLTTEISYKKRKI